MLINISEEDEVQKVILFLDILKHITLLVQKHQVDYWPVNLAPRNLDLNTISPSFDFDVFQNQKMKVYESLSENIKTYTETTDRIFRFHKLKGWAKDNFKYNESEPIIHLLEISNVATHALFLYIDFDNSIWVLTTG